MKHSVLFAMILSLSASPAAATEIIGVCFTPGEACTDLIVDQIASARRQVLVQAYSFTSPDIVTALADAKRRGVDVQVILDKSNVCKDRGECEKKGALAAKALKEAGVPVFIDRAHAIAHNKIMVIDQSRVITGSFNFSQAAQDRNAENVLVISDNALAHRYRANWREHGAHSTALSPQQNLANNQGILVNRPGQ
ncbi:phospholipase D family nuclease [Paramagnetospirillum caucaseum]|nr:phospholipase D family protein [Paramagnetospirillum caucaseum]